MKFDFQTMDEINSLNPKTRKKLVDEIAKACENAYRRGFEQGFVVGIGGHSDVVKKPTKMQVDDWRYRKRLNTCAPGNPHAGRREDIVERLDMECTSPLIQQLLDPVHPTTTKTSEKRE